MSFYSDEYKHVLLAERAMAKMLEKEDLKGAEGAQVTRALCDAIRLKRDMRGVPDPRPVDVSKPAGKSSRPKSLNSHASPLPDPPPTDAPVRL